MSQLQNLSGDITVAVRIPAETTAGDADTWALLEAPNDIEIVGVAVIFDEAVTGAATNNFAVAVQNEGTDGTGTTAVTDTTTFASGTDATAHVPVDLTLSSTEANLDVDEGEVIALARTVNGTGLASPTGLVQVTYRNR